MPSAWDSTYGNRAIPTSPANARCRSVSKPSLANTSCSPSADASDFAAGSSDLHTGHVGDTKSTNVFSSCAAPPMPTRLPDRSSASTVSVNSPTFGPRVGIRAPAGATR